jgi:predicted amidohydrolase YtcJ
MHDTVIYPARRILTMNRGAPSAQAVAVREGKVLGVGTVEELQSWGPATVDERFADKVIVPGFVEAHSHVMSGGAWRMPYVGFFNRTDPQGNRWTGCTTIDEVIDRLIEVESTMEDPSEILLAWGLDPIYFTGERLLAKHLDRVSTVRQIFVYHANGHLASVNTAMLNASEITAASTSPGVARDADGNPNGELQESAMSLASSAFVKLRSMWGSPEANGTTRMKPAMPVTRSLPTWGRHRSRSPAKLSHGELWSKILRIRHGSWWPSVRRLGDQLTRS